MTEVYVAFDLKSGTDSDYHTFLECLKKKKWRISTGILNTVYARFKPSATRTHIQETLQKEFNGCAEAIGKSYSATAKIGQTEWTFYG